MSRLVSKNTRGRQPLLSTPKVAKPKGLLDHNYQDTNNNKRRGGGKYVATVQQAKKRRRAPSTPSESSASSSDAEDEAEEDESESDEDEPLALAPPLNNIVGQAGRPFPLNEFDDNISEVGSVASMFDPNFMFVDEDPEMFPLDENSRNKVFDDSDDDAPYEAVDDISDDDDADVEAFEEQQLIASLSDDEIGEGEFLNQIDGLSEYGFGNESDGTAHFPPSSHGSDTEPAPQRHVRFEIEALHALNSTLSSSPTISRALLPSALPEHAGIYGGPASAAAQAAEVSPSEATYDCMLASEA